jgi:hypothetical protein
MPRSSKYVKDLATIALETKSSEHVLQELFEKYDNKLTLLTMSAYVKFQCLLQANDHIAVLIEAEKEHPEIAERIQSLKRKSMYEVQQEQMKCRKRAKLDDDHIIGNLDIIPKYIRELTIPTHMHRDIQSHSYQQHPRGH